MYMYIIYIYKRKRRCCDSRKNETGEQKTCGKRLKIVCAINTF